jgi:uncharacterized membrane protein
MVMVMVTVIVIVIMMVSTSEGCKRQEREDTVPRLHARTASPLRPADPSQA